MSSQVVVITGLMASGKSTVAQAVAEKLPRSVHLRGDVFRKMIVSGRAEMTPEPSVEALVQLELRYRLACDSCATYATAGFNVVYQDVILGQHLEAVVSRLARFAPLVILLNPSFAEIAKRDASRPKTAYGGSWTPAALGASLRETPRLGHWIDTSSMTVPDTAALILNQWRDLQS